MVEQRQRDAATLALTAFRYGGGGLIAFFFLVIVMIATAQQDVLTRMKSEGLSVGYSSALALREQVKGKADKIPALEESERKLALDLDATQAELEQRQREFDMAWEAFQPSVARLYRTNLCDLAPPSSDTPGTRAAIVNEVRQCQLDQGASSSAIRTLSAAQSEADRFTRSSHAYFAALERLGKIKRQLAFTQSQLNSNRALTDAEQKAARSFGDMDVLLQPWLVFGDALVQFPPPLLQILLTFVSGLFGALLVTLILVVYPSNKISDATDARPVARTFLGGFIALCVYIVVLSGTAVLGAQNTSNGAGTNYMAFCGIGILAGMFSDRVAGWLSDRADQFFKQGASGDSRNSRHTRASGSAHGAGGGQDD